MNRALTMIALASSMMVVLDFGLHAQTPTPTPTPRKLGRTAAPGLITPTPTPSKVPGIRIMNPGGTDSPNSLPWLNTASPNSVRQGQQNASITLTARNTNFQQGVTTADFGAGIAVISLRVTSLTTAVAVVNIAADAPVGAHNVRMNTQGELVDMASTAHTFGAANVSGFAVNAFLNRSAATPVTPVIATATPTTPITATTSPGGSSATPGAPGGGSQSPGSGTQTSVPGRGTTATLPGRGSVNTPCSANFTYDSRDKPFTVQCSRFAVDETSQRNVAAAEAGITTRKAIWAVTFATPWSAGEDPFMKALVAGTSFKTVTFSFTANGGQPASTISLTLADVVAVKKSFDLATGAATEEVTLGVDKVEMQ
jgi:hypothetical protein